MAVLKGKKSEDIIKKIQEVFHSSSGIADECALINIRRIYYLAMISSTVRVLDIIIFFNAKSTSQTWSRGIIISHITLLFIWVAFFIIAYQLKKKPKANIQYVFAVQYAVVSTVMLSGIIITTIDQLITTNITPFIVVCIVTGGVFLLRPVVSVFVFLSSYIIYYHAIAYTITDEQILLSNRVNGITVITIGLIISIMFWHYNYINIVQRRRIAAQQEQLEQMAYYDPLTNIYNRHFFNIMIEKEYSSIMRHNHEAALIFLDVDDFKKVNDVYGHLIGDEVLIQMAQLIARNIRGYDTLARFGGEEFIVLAPKISLAEGIKFADKLRKIIANNSFDAGRDKLHMTASLGVTLLDPQEKGGLEKCLMRADQALYRAKNKGKNRVEVI